VPAECADQIRGALHEPLPSPNANVEDIAPYFGLQNVGSTFQLGFFVGMARLPNSEGPVLIIHPRFQDLDYASMFAVCADDPEVYDLGATFFVWPDKPPIDGEPAPHWFTPLLVIAFLSALDRLCKRHLRRNYLREVKNLTGRMKGRLKLREHIRNNILRYRPERVVCEYGLFDDDCLENRILRAALEVSRAYMVQHSGFITPAILGWIRTCRAALARVSIARIHPRHFGVARQMGTFRHYRDPHRLARAVLRHLGIDPENLGHGSDRMRVPPFALCTYELFERYAETILRKSDPDLWSGGWGKERNLGLGRYKTRPDFIRPKAGVILDCKYKRFPDGRISDQERADIYQIAAYSRHKGVLDKICHAGGPDKPQKLVLLYPDVEYAEPSWCGSESRDDQSLHCDDFEVPLLVKRLYCPRLQSRTHAPLTVAQPLDESPEGL